MPSVYLVRHAQALGRQDWRQPDDIRPLSKRGRRQADAVAHILRGADIRRVLSSPAIRCRETVEPVARATGVEVELANELLEGTAAGPVVTMIDRLLRDDHDSVLCSHGDLIPGVLRKLAARGTKLHDELRWAKGSVWELVGDAGGVHEAHYCPPDD